MEAQRDTLHQFAGQHAAWASQQLGKPGTRAAVAVVDERGYSIGYADLGVGGYTPTTYYYETYDEASAAAREINRLAFDLTLEREVEIILSSMRGQGVFA